MDKSQYNAGEVWKEYLKDNRLEGHCNSYSELNNLKRLNMSWRKILKITQLRPPAQVFELGCGGGTQMVKLALNGFEVHGIDISDAVVSRAKHFLDDIRKFRPIKASVEVADIFNYETKNCYDLCFHFGVVEHFLEDDQRHRIWEKLFEFTKPGGWIVSCVPCGQHFMRKMVQEKILEIPEIDYSCRLHRSEFEMIGLEEIRAVPYVYFKFLEYHPSKIVSKIIRPMLQTFGYLWFPWFPVSENIKERYAHSLMVMGRKLS